MSLQIQEMRKEIDALKKSNESIDKLKVKLEKAKAKETTLNATIKELKIKSNIKIKISKEVKNTEYNKPDFLTKKDWDQLRKQGLILTIK